MKKNFNPGILIRLLLLLGLTLPACARSQSALAVPLPVTFRLASQMLDLGLAMTPVKNQGERNTCNAFAATSLMEFLIRRETGKNLDLSEAYNYWASKTYALDTAYLRENYLHIDGLAGFLAVRGYAFGSLAEADWPYEPTNWEQQQDPRCQSQDGKPAMECYTGAPPPSLSPLPYRLKPVFVERDRIAAFIQREKKPVIVNLMWLHAAVDAKGNVRMLTPTEQKQASGHVITLTGYNPKTRRFLFRNSYGPGWGTKGYGTIPEDYILQLCEVCPYLPAAGTYPPEIRDFVLKGSQGVSGELETSAP